MPLDPAGTREYLNAFDFRGLFVQELGWDRHAGQIQIALDGGSFTLSAVAEKHGVQVLVCTPDVSGRIPDHHARCRIHRKVKGHAHEHLIIFRNSQETEQYWSWVHERPGQPKAYRGHAYHVGQTGEALIQKLSNISFTLNDEEGLTIFGVVVRLRDAFDREKITKRFYDRFKAEHDAFLKFIAGIPDEELQRWYASVMLNRLMFIYFIQRKGFLDGDDKYLMTKLDRSKKLAKDRYYKHFLCQLFFNGFAGKAGERSPEISDLLGDVPYLNGGLFLKHQIEELHGNQIQIADRAFERLFDFFEQYQWHLDERPLRRDNEINPDVLGYIFEKYINQKQMGAYYTKEDITGYISKNTVIPFLFDQARRKCTIAFEGEQSIWKLLQADPDRYLYEAVRRGVIDDDGNVIPESALPDFVQKGMSDPKARMFDKWYNLGEADLRNGDGNRLTLPTETWREYIERRNRCLALREKLTRGEVRTVNDFISYNLDIRQFAQDVIWNAEGPELLRAFYHAIENVTVLDPTCGSGAFLFAALNILEPLYEACLDRMQVFLDELDRSGEKHRSDKYGDFRKILARVSAHPNLKYFVFKSIIVNNLYGIDIMEEAVEICKLRLFLKLVAQIDDVNRIEPLPDIDFNIKAGNTLVGFAKYDQLKETLQSDLVSMQSLPAIEEKAEEVDRLFKLFHQQQTELGGEVTPEDKQELRSRLKALEDELNRHLAGEYGVNIGKTSEYQKWLESHKPFHWFIEFYGIMKSGGFDVIIGNPPYVERSKFGNDYLPHGLRTIDSKDIYAWIVERALALTDNTSRTGLIVPVSISSSGSFYALRNVLCESPSTLWMSHFANRPGQLFAGAQNRLAIMLRANGERFKAIFSTRYHRWDTRGDERSALFSLITYVATRHVEKRFHGLFPKIGTQEALRVLEKLDCPKKLAYALLKNSPYHVCWVRVPGYFCQFFLSPPKAWPEGGGPERIRGEVISIFVESIEHQKLIHAVLNSSSFYQFYCTYSDGRHINPSDVKDFPLDLRTFLATEIEELSSLSMKLEQGTRDSISLWRKSGLLIESVDSTAVKPVIDQIDCVLAKHYGFTDEELDFIINYDIKYRMGRGTDEE